MTVSGCAGEEEPAVVVQDQRGWGDQAGRLRTPGNPQDTAGHTQRTSMAHPWHTAGHTPGNTKDTPQGTLRHHREPCGTPQAHNRAPSSRSGPRPRHPLAP